MKTKLSSANVFVNVPANSAQDSMAGGKQDAAPCSDKLAFDSREEAEATATVAQYRYGGTPPKAYACRYCGLWHLSTS